MFELLLFLVLAHFTADFVLQTNRVNKLKKINRHKGLAIHTVIHLAVSLLALCSYEAASQQSVAISATIVAAVVLVTIIHYLIDWLKEMLTYRYNNAALVASLFVLDQILHIASIFVVFDRLGLVSYSYYEFQAKLLGFLFGHAEFSDINKLLLLVVIIILATKGAGYFLGIVLKDLMPNQTLNKGKYNISNEQTEFRTTVNEKGEKKNLVTTTKTEQLLKDSPQRIGRYIGMIERLLIMIFIVQGTPQGLPFLIAVKSLTRFKQFESKQFAEYYLIGSLLSALIAVVLGYLVLRII